MGNQRQIRKGKTAISTSTRNRLGIDIRVHLCCIELAATVEMQFAKIGAFEASTAARSPCRNASGGFFGGRLFLRRSA